MLKIGDAVKAEGYTGVIVEPDETMLAMRKSVSNRVADFWWVRFNGLGPHGDGIGIYHRTSYKIFRLAIPK